MNHLNGARLLDFVYDFYLWIFAYCFVSFRKQMNERVFEDKTFNEAMQVMKITKQ